MIRTVTRTALRPADAQMLETKRFSRDEMMQALWRAGTTSDHLPTQARTGRADPVRG